MTEDVVNDFLHVLRRCIGAPVQQRVAARRQVERERRTRRGAVLDHLVRLARLEHDVEDVVADLLVAIDLLQRRAQGLDVLRRADRLRLRRRGVLRKALHDAALVRLRGRLDKALEHEAVDLRFGKRIRPLLLDRVLRRKDQERLRQAVCLLADRHLLLLHRLEKRGLHLRRRTVDFIGQQKVREHRTLLRRELARLRRIDQGADDIGRQQIRRKGNALEVQPQHLRQRVHAERFRQARYALQENMPARHQRQHQSVDQLLLTDDHLADLLADSRHQFRLRGDPVRRFLQIHVSYPF